MEAHVKRPENGRKSIFREKQTSNKLPLMFLAVKVVTKRYQFRFWIPSTNKEITVYVFSFSETENKK